ncbi:MAG: SMR family transporter, partial [Pseudomonadota bacterium]
YSACFWMLAPAMKALPVGLVYAVWAGIGIVAASAIGVYAFQDKLNLIQLGCIGLVLVGVVGLRLTSST